MMRLRNLAENKRGGTRFVKGEYVLDDWMCGSLSECRRGK